MQPQQIPLGALRRGKRQQHQHAGVALIDQLELQVEPALAVLDQAQQLLTVRRWADFEGKQAGIQ
ncbi:hypothetical protein D3C80_2172170 [compost metagenome]